MQGLGWMHALLPVLRRRSDVAAALGRHMVVFGTNAFAAPALLGAVSRLEMDGQGDAGTRVRDMLAAPLSGAADLYYWGALRPAAVAVGLVLAVAGVPAAGAALLLVAFNLPAQRARWRTFALGVAAGGELLRRRDAVLPPRAWIRPLRAVAGFVAGALAAWGTATAAGRGGAVLFDVGLAILVGYHACRRHVSPGLAFLVVVALGTVLRHLDLAAGTLR